MKGSVIGALGEPSGPLRLLVLLVDGRRVVTGELSEQERSDVGAQVAGRLREPHPGARSMVRWLHPVLAVVVRLEAGQVSGIALPTADD